MPKLVGGRWKCDGCEKTIKPTEEISFYYGGEGAKTECCYNEFSWEPKWEDDPLVPDGPRTRTSGLSEAPGLPLLPAADSPPAA